MFLLAYGSFWCNMVHMKAITLRLTEEEKNKLNRIKDQGFSSLNEVIKCATLSFLSSKPRKNRRKQQTA